MRVKSPICSVGISGDTSENDEACAVYGIQCAGLVADTGDPASEALHRGAGFREVGRLEKVADGRRVLVRRRDVLRYLGEGSA